MKKSGVKKMICTAEIKNYDGKNLTLSPSVPIDSYLLYRQSRSVEIRLVDGREITAEQRRKIYATLRDIYLFSGQPTEDLKEWFKLEYIIRNGGEYFSLSDCDRTTAREFINLLLDFCLRYGVPLNEPMTERTDDTDRFLYMCMWYRKCAVCGRPADIHHTEGFRVGIGADRKTAHHLKRKCIALCRLHHQKAHDGEGRFFKDNHIYGVELDEALCDRLNLRR